MTSRLDRLFEEGPYEALDRLDRLVRAVAALRAERTSRYHDCMKVQEGLAHWRHTANVATNNCGDWMRAVEKAEAEIAKVTAERAYLHEESVRHLRRAETAERERDELRARPYGDVGSVGDLNHTARELCDEIDQLRGKVAAVGALRDRLGRCNEDAEYDLVLVWLNDALASGDAQGAEPDEVPYPGPYTEDEIRAAFERLNDETNQDDFIHNIRYGGPDWSKPPWRPAAQVTPSPGDEPGTEETQ